MRAPFFLITIPFLCVLTPRLYAQGNDKVTAPPPGTGRINPGMSINSRFHETRPVLTPDGRKMYFSRKHHPDNVGGSDDPQDVYFSESRDGISWSTPVNAGPQINSPSADNLCGITPDGELIFFIAEERGRGSFVIRDCEENERRIGPAITNESPYLEASFSADLQTLVFTARTKRNISYSGARDERDIYFSVRQGSGWTEPANLGPSVNTGGDEYSPFLCPDGRTLFFASDGRGGFGGADVFVCRRVGNGWFSWTEPKNLGRQINSPAFDGYLSIPAGAEIAYLVSSAGSLGKTDILKIVIPEAMRPASTERHLFRVSEQESNDPVSVEIQVRDDSGNLVSSGITDEETGEVSLYLPWGENLVASIQEDRFRPVRTFVQPGSYQHTFRLHRITKGSNAIQVFFHRGSELMVNPSLPVLDSAIALLRRYPAARVELVGHTDNFGSHRGLKTLSERRVVAVRHYLVRNGIPASRIAGRGVGGTQPVAANSDEQSRSRNRRVEFLITDLY